MSIEASFFINTLNKTASLRNALYGQPLPSRIVGPQKLFGIMSTTGMEWHVFGHFVRDWSSICNLLIISNSLILSGICDFIPLKTAIMGCGSSLFKLISWSVMHESQHRFQFRCFQRS
ncbi:hypothetical protein NPIL_168111 [Nephila pilipes]|uniref:Uncharacterized protein n=1 Tax=Nephila pilipes TaxID=299642 RepID=A0A8X6MU14_NEPPI|nr:hypothetical protein NPIL_168111 [Nephila pilipes]